MRKRAFFYIILIAVIYILLLQLLVQVENGADKQTIFDFGDAFWFSVVTMTTVGFGDVYPDTLAGRAIGCVFLIISTGVLAALVYSIGNLIRSKLMPLVRVQLTRGKTCCVFSELNQASVALAWDLMKNDPSRRVFFCGVNKNDTRIAQVTGKSFLFMQQNVISTVRSVAGGRKEYSGKLMVFLISDDISNNYIAAKELEKMPVRIFCRGPEVPMITDVRFFDAPDCSARQYWKRYPLEPSEHTILLIGNGRLGSAILSHSVIVNCRIPFETSVWHLFGNWENYRRFHYSLQTAFSINKIEEGRDSIIYHEKVWNEDPELIKAADRIIFCGDDAEENIKNAALMRAYFPFAAKVTIAGPGEYGDVNTFAETKRVFTEELVVGAALDRRAKALHDAYCRSVGETDNPWESLPLFTKESNRSAADSVFTKVRILLSDDPPEEADRESCRKAFERWQAVSDRDPYRRNEHERWLRFYCLYNWRYGEKKDKVQRTHPCIVDYDYLPEEERIKDDAAWEQLGVLAREDLND